MKVSDVVKFVVKNRKNKVCKDWSPYQITHAVYTAIQDHALSYVEQKGKIVGVVWGTVTFHPSNLHIDCILTTKPKVLHQLMAHFNKHFKGFGMTADRHDRFVTYDVEKLKIKLNYGN